MSAPLVSILIPTHERPAYLREALLSALAQTHRELDIVITDNSASEASREAVDDLVRGDSRVRYLRCPERQYYLENWLHGLSHCEGEYLNFLMDDDLFHPDKVARMAGVLARQPDIAVVTSYRQLIDGRGRRLADLPDTAPLFGGDALVRGEVMGSRIIQAGVNLVGEPTTAMVRRADLAGCFGFYAGRQYQVLSDVATWLRLLQRGALAYLREPLSQFRLHGGQDQRRELQVINANLEWLQLLLDARADGYYLKDSEAFHKALQNQLDSVLPYLTSQRETLRSGAIDAETVQRLMRQGIDALFHA